MMMMMETNGEERKREIEKEEKKHTEREGALRVAMATGDTSLRFHRN